MANPKNAAWYSGGLSMDVGPGVGNAADIGIFNNVFILPANTAGAAITLSAGTAGSAIFGNHANYGDTDMGNNPYTDSAGAGSNTWGLNYQAITAVLPT